MPRMECLQGGFPERFRRTTAEVQHLSQLARCIARFPTRIVLIADSRKEKLYSSGIAVESQEQLLLLFANMASNGPPSDRNNTLGRVKNKAPAPVQITAEQLLREAWENKELSGASVVAPRHQIADAEELAEYQQTTRKSFEDRIVRSRSNMSSWLKYARWEEAQRDFVRARSVFERAIDTDYRSHIVWSAYAEMEMRHKFINHARNVWDRAVTFLPRVSQLWVKYAFMEEMLLNVSLARLVYVRWLKWMPDISAYTAFVQFEMRHRNVDQARIVYEKMIAAHPSVNAYLKYASFEEEHGDRDTAREVFERASDLPDIETSAEFYLAFAHFEERRKEIARARAIYEFALSKVSPYQKPTIHEAFAQFEKQRGNRSSVEAVVSAKKEAEYEEHLTSHPRDYDTWFDLIKLVESTGDAARIRSIYGRAVEQKPPATEKRFWRRYIFLWIDFAVWEELEACDLNRAVDVYRKCLASIPNNHKSFSFGKVWVLAAKLEIRRKDPSAARKLLGHALGVMPQKDSIYREYIAMELALEEFDRARSLFRKWLERNPTKSAAFISFADMEFKLAELHRARSVFELGVNSPEIDEPETLWRAYIEFEETAGEEDRVIALFERLIKRSGRVGEWLEYAEFVAKTQELPCRDIYLRASKAMKDEMLEKSKDREKASADRVRVLESWLDWERSIVTDGVNDTDQVARVEAMMPKRIKRRRAVFDSRGNDAGWEEYFEYVFPEEQDSNPKLKILERARLWKLQQQQFSHDAKQSGHAATV